MARGVMNFRNAAPKGELAADATRKEVIVEFARRLQAELVRRGWSQGDLVSAAQPHVPEGKSFAPYDVSNYIRGRSLPAAHKLQILCETLGLKPDELIPHRGQPEVQRSTARLETRVQDEDGNVWIRLNRAVSHEGAARIQAILNNEDRGWRLPYDMFADVLGPRGDD